MERAIKLSLAIVTYNNELIIENTINSIIHNIPKSYDYMLYIIDNNSTDKTIDIVKGLKGNLYTIENKHNRGFGYGHNIVINQIDSDFHLVVNPDIIIENQDQIEKIIEYMITNIDVGLVSPLIVNPDYSVQHLCKKNPTVLDMLIRRISPSLLKQRQDSYTMKETGYNKIMKIEYATGCFMVFRSDIFRQIKGFDDSFFMYLEDADITRRVNEISSSYFFPEARVIHMWKRDGHKKLKYSLITLKSMSVYFKKWGWKFY